MNEEVGLCAFCGMIASQKCANCKLVFYCKKDCQKADWKKVHKEHCLAFKIEEDRVIGRHLVATRDVKAGDVILKEDPIVTGPKQITEPICLTCYKRVDGSHRCGKCNWPLCSAKCEDSSDHQPECVIGQEIGSPIDISDFNESNHFYEVVTPLRCLTLKKRSTKKYEQLLSLESHYEDRKNTHVYTENQKRTVNMLRNYFMLAQFDKEEIDSSEITIHKITGILDVNAVEIRMPQCEIVGLYPTFAMLEHSCTPNTKHTFKDKQLVLKASVDIKKGEHLSTMYTHILWGTIARREHLKLNKYFMCTCQRCTDATEVGTNFSSLRCSNCSHGFLLSAAPLDELADWMCTNCNVTLPVDKVNDITLLLGEKVEKVLEKPTIKSLEEIIEKSGSTTVHPNHFHLFAAKHTLLQMYGRDGDTREATMQKKEKLCQSFLKTCTALDPGMSRLAPYASVALYEYHLAILARVRQAPNSMTEGEAIRNDLETAKKLLFQCIKMLEDEPEDLPEGQLRLVAQQNLAELQSWGSTL